MASSRSSALPQHEKDRYIALEEARSAAWEAAYEAAEEKASFRGKLEQPTNQPPPPTPEQIAEEQARQVKQKAEQDEQALKAAAQRRFLLEILASPPAEIRARLSAAPPEVCDEPILARALIRWMDGNARRGPEIVEYTLHSHDPQGVLRKISKLEPVPIEFLVEWAILDRDAFMAWAKDRLCGWRAQAISTMVMPEKSEWEIASRLQQLHGKALKSKFHQLWMALDPLSALTRPSRYNDESDIYDAIDELCRSDPPANYWRSAIAPYMKLNRCSGSNEAWGVTTTWAPGDFIALVKQYGLPWCLRSEEFKKSQVPRMFSNREAMENESGLRNTFSALRTWAILRPKEMRTWIDSETFTPDLREALLWLLDNAGGGIAVPDPAKVP